MESFFSQQIREAVYRRIGVASFDWPESARHALDVAAQSGGHSGSADRNSTANKEMVIDRLCRLITTPDYVGDEPQTS
jgi:hypothetical protein